MSSVAHSKAAGDSCVVRLLVCPAPDTEHTIGFAHHVATVVARWLLAAKFARPCAGRVMANYFLHYILHAA
jgi:hypothetical protein